jgi:PAS domain-containing protein
MPDSNPPRTDTDLHLSTILEASPITMLVFSHRGELILANRPAERLFGVPTRQTGRSDAATSSGAFIGSRHPRGANRAPAGTADHPLHWLQRPGQRGSGAPCRDQGGCHEAVHQKEVATLLRTVLEHEEPLP